MIWIREKEEGSVLLMLTFPVVGPPVHQILGGAPAGPRGPHHLLQLGLHVLGRGFPRQLSFGPPTPPHHSLLTLEIRQIKFSFDFELIMRKTGNAIIETIKYQQEQEIFKQS